MSSIELLGVRIDGNGPVRHDHLRLEPGMTVLYGKNGSGKTRLLNAIAGGEFLVRWPLPQVNWPLASSPWTAGWRSPDVAFEAVVGHVLRGSAQPFDVGAYMLESRTSLDVERERFAAINELPYPVSVLRRFWEIVVSTVGVGSVHDELVPVVVGALRELVEQSLFSVQKGRDGRFHDHSIITHRIRLDSTTPCCQRLLELGREALRSWSADFDDEIDLDDVFVYEVLRPARTGFLMLEAIDAEVSSTEAPWWFGLPTHRFASAPTLHPIHVISEDDTDLDTAALEWMSPSDAWASPAPHERLVQEGPGSIEILPLAFELAATLGDSANRYITEILEDAPPLRLVFTDPARWTSRHRLEWQAQAGNHWIPIRDLSAAQARWARFAVQLAMTETPTDLPVLILLDEPEMGLHRRAERRLVEALARLGRGRGATVIVATHSPAFLRSDLASLRHVRSHEGRTITEVMPAEPRARMSDLGLDPADLLQLCRTVLLVEGEHDVAVLDELFANELAAAGVHLFPMRGAKALKAVADAQLLFDFTDADVVVMLDNESTERVERLWNAAYVAFGSDDTSWLDLLDELRSGSSGGEGNYLKEFCSRAIKHHQRDSASSCFRGATSASTCRSRHSSNHAGSISTASRRGKTSADFMTGRVTATSRNGSESRSEPTSRTSRSGPEYED